MEAREADIDQMLEEFKALKKDVAERRFVSSLITALLIMMRLYRMHPICALRQVLARKRLARALVTSTTTRPWSCCRSHLTALCNSSLVCLFYESKLLLK